jgi:hypothetical protein
MAVIEYMPPATEKYHGQLDTDQIKEHNNITLSLFICFPFLMFFIPLSAINRNPFPLSLRFCLHPFHSSTVFFLFAIFLFLSLQDSLPELIKNVCGQMVE